MDISTKLKSLLPSLLFEVYFLSAIILFFATQGLPKNPFWLISFFIKIGLGYLVFRLYISRNKKIAVAGPWFVLVLAIAAYLIFFISPGLSETLGGYGAVLLSANSLFLFRYLRNPNIVLAMLDTRYLENKSKDNYFTYYKTANIFYSIGSRRFTIIVELLLFCWAMIEVFIGGSGILQLWVLISWIIIHASTEGIMTPKSRSIERKQPN
ncbi:MAG: hypothetical protein Q7J73_09605 [Dehalococcoidales bacterium]|nr:hypothetical protein [Dehalococcoidales bacterium]